MTALPQPIADTDNKRSIKVKFKIREASPADGDAMLALMPRLAAFDMPAGRNPEDLWGDDAKLMIRWINGEESCLVHVAESDDAAILGFSLTRLRPDALSHQPSAHLEAIAVDQNAQGYGVAGALLDATEKSAQTHGAKSMTLHVISTNQHAIGFYEHKGYFGEMVRYIKPIQSV